MTRIETFGDNVGDEKYETIRLKYLTEFKQLAAMGRVWELNREEDYYLKKFRANKINCDR